MTQRIITRLSLVLGLAFGVACGGEVEDEPEHRVQYTTSSGEEVVVEGEDEDEVEENMETVEEHLEEREDIAEERYDD